jgi:hypothetical protein
MSGNDMNSLSRTRLDGCRKGYGNGQFLWNKRILLTSFTHTRIVVHKGCLKEGIYNLRRYIHQALRSTHLLRRSEHLRQVIPHDLRALRGINPMPQTLALVVIYYGRRLGVVRH